MGNKFFCPLPWNHLLFKQKGTVQACCETWDSQFKPAESILATANLDITHEINLIKIIKEKSKEGFGVLIALHDLNLAYNFSDRIALLKDGEIKYIGKPSEVITEKKLQEIYNTPISIDKNNRFIKYY